MRARGGYTNLDEQSWTAFQVLTTLGTIIALAGVIVGGIGLGLLITWNSDNVKTISGVKPVVNGEVSVLPGIALSETTDVITAQVVLNNEGVWNVTVLNNLTVNQASHAIVLDNTGVRDVYPGLNVSVSGGYYKTIDNTGVREATAGQGISVSGTYYKTISNTGVLSVICTGAGMNCTNTTGNVAIGTTAVLTFNGQPPDGAGDVVLNGYYNIIVDNGPLPNGNQVWYELSRRYSLPASDPNGPAVAYAAVISNVAQNTWRMSLNPGFTQFYVPGLLAGDGGAGDIGGHLWAPAYEGLFTLNVMMLYTVSAIDPESHMSVTSVICFDCVDENPFNGINIFPGGLQTHDINTGSYSTLGNSIFGSPNGPRIISFSADFEVCQTCEIQLGMPLTMHTRLDHSNTNNTLITPTMSATFYFRIAQKQ